MRRSIMIFFAGLLLALAVLVGVPRSAHAETFIVNSMADSPDVNPGDGICDDGTGACTLRAAIWEANFGGPDVIHFDIGDGGLQTINLANPLPYIYSELVIDGTTQPGFAGTPLIEIDAAGMNTYTGQPPMAASNSSSLTVKYLKISNAADVGFSMQRVDNALIEGLDVSYPSGAQGYGVHAFTNIDNLIIRNVTANNRRFGIAVENYSEPGSDVQLYNNDLRDNTYGVFLRDVRKDLLPGGVTASGNKFSGSDTALWLIDMADLIISGNHDLGPNFFIDATDGLDAASNISIYLQDSERITIDSLDLSLASGLPGGQGVNFFNVNDLAIQNSTISNREWAVYGSGGTGFQALNNTLSGNEIGLVLRSLSVLPDDLMIAGNSFDSSTKALQFSHMSGLVVSDGSLTGTNVVLDAGAGLDTVPGVALELINVDDSWIEGVDLSIDPSNPYVGLGLYARNSIDNLTIQKVMVANRDTGISISGGSNLLVRCSDFENNAFGLYTDISGAGISENNFDGNSTGLYFDGIAEYNYWGAADGPGNLGGSGDSYYGLLDADPFLTSPSTCQGVPSGPSDSDSDGVPDDEDVFPLDPTEWADNDGDGIGDNADPDDDNDGVADVDDAFPLDPAEWADNDGDDIGDNADLDDDNDGVADVDDAFPLDPTRGVFCPVGWFGAFTCVEAPAGSYVALEGQLAATLCEIGRYQPLMGQTSCLDASAGHFVDTMGAAAQTACAPGTFQELTGQSSCIKAAPGHFASGFGSTAQSACSLGTYQPDAGEESCLPAPIGSYVDTTGAIAAAACPEGTTTLGEASISIDDCVPDSPTAALEALISDIEMLENEGRLHNGNGLIAKLEQVIAKLDRNDTGAACNELGAFNNQVDAFLGSGHLSPGDGQDLLDRAERIMIAIGCS